MAETLVPIAVFGIFIGIFAMLFGLRYLTNKERMAMIERGISPSLPKRRSQPLQTLKWGLLLCGSGLGLLLAFTLTNYVLMTSEEKAPAIYFSMIAICGGLGLVTSYRFEKHHEDKERASQVLERRHEPMEKMNQMS